jgi:hypothetical protein
VNVENLRMLELAAERLGDLLHEVVFLGGVTVELWITDEAAPEFRPTADVDVIAEITTMLDFYRFQDRLLEIGFVHDATSRVICRFRYPNTELVLDVMPTEPSILGFENRWQGAAFRHAEEIGLPSGQTIEVIQPPFLVATKLEAFRSRGRQDFFASRDFADVVALIDGREEIEREIGSASGELRRYVAEELLELSLHPEFDRGLEGALPSSPESRERVDRVIWPRLRQVMALGADEAPL